MRGKHREVDFKGLAVAADLKVVEDDVAAREMVSQVCDRLTLGVIHGLADGDHRCHQAASSMARPDERASALLGSRGDVS